MRKNRLLGAAWVLLLLVLISTQWVCGLYARFTAKGVGSGSARVAAFVFFTEDEESSCILDLSEIQKPGDSRTYTFTVTNQKGDTVSEVAENIQINVQLKGSMPLVCNVFRKDAAEPILTANMSSGTAQALPVMFPAGRSHTETYTMKVEWPKEQNDIQYASRGAVAEALLTVTAEQAD